MIMATARLYDIIQTHATHATHMPHTCHIYNYNIRVYSDAGQFIVSHGEYLWMCPREPSGGREATFLAQLLRLDTIVLE